MSLLPQLTQSQVALTKEVQVLDERGRVSIISIPVERSLTVYLDKRELLTLMTMGGNPEMLVLGYLRNQRLIRSLAEIVAVQVDWEVNAVAVTTHHGVTDIEERTAKRVVTTGCGQGTVFGGLMDEVDQIHLPVDAKIKQTAVYRVVDTIRTHPSIYKKAGSVHACALFSAGGDLLYFVEDVGRHNAVDAIAGKMWLDGISGGDKIFYTTGRLTSEMVIKGAQMGIPILLSRSGTTEMGLQVAEQVGMSLFSRCTGRHFLLLTHPQRLEFELDMPDLTPNQDFLKV
ncbi:MAG: formate dehydrogenase accessory sulfurtransferase FdhD [Undibacterium sp.]|uniref:formate dehydrogenase accessory sulfurtransferase FdhD n=1 Tax=Undibacterium sp. TaxID=1914977 RepID=UPI0027214F32|nr:formate dehydrogenase accessory sulfurtransferase FdhD [Undibacterium sp.]MDO8652798.1 formate dehydrogenase accessory sulfurtransferase FdhD [Undibacterium sp.]